MGGSGTDVESKVAPALRIAKRLQKNGSAAYELMRIGIRT
ncbi:MAG: hypothetical protein QOE26_326 [Verrucomicrobiota bacterium]|jgi:hypothetical protein